jgi:hypothetical protein
VALNLVMACWRPERGKSTDAIAACLSPWQAYRRWASNIGRLTATWWSFKARGTRSAGGQLRWAYLSRPWSKGVRWPAPGVIRGEDPFTLKRYPGTSEHESPHRRESRRGGHRRQGALHQGSSSVYYTIRTPFRSSDRVICRAFISDFYVATCKSLCNKVLAL